MRVFICSNRPFVGNIGGGGGVNYRLASINASTYRYKNVINVFSDCDVTADSFKAVSERLSVSQQTVKSNLRERISRSPLGFYNLMNLRQKKAERMLRRADSNYRFCSDDVFILHDIETAKAFSSLFSFKKNVIVYHNQGSLYYEWSNTSLKKSKWLRRWLNSYMEKAFRSVSVWGFPSYGALESLIATEPSFAFLASGEKEIEVFYNGIDINSTKPASMPSLLEEELSTFSGLVFATVSTLNEAKGVDRIPAYLEELKKEGIRFKWVLIGQGARSNEVAHEIHKAGIESDVIWIQNRVDHNSVLAVLRQSDFYLMLHRYSIFDFATVEAMSCGCIPLLSSIGGNKEVLVDQNGFFVDEPCDLLNAISCLDDNKIASLKKQNSELQQRLFSEKAFFARYIDFSLKQSVEPQQEATGSSCA